MATPDERRALPTHPAGTDPANPRSLPLEAPEGTVFVPSPPEDGEHTLTAVDGELSWVEAG